MRVDESVRTSQTASLLASISTVVSIVRLGTDMFCEEAGHNGGEFGGALRVRVVPGAFEAPERPERSAAVDWRGLILRSSAVPASRTTLGAGNTSAGLAEPGVPDAADGMKRNTLRGIPGARTMIPRSGSGKARVAAVWSEARLMRRMDRGSCAYSMADGISRSWN